MQMGLGLSITAWCLLSVWPSVGSSIFYRPFATGLMLISNNLCKDEINMHKAQHGSLPLVSLGVRLIK